MPSNRLRAAAIPPTKASTSRAVMEKRSLLRAFPDRDGAAHPHHKPRGELDADGLQLVVDDGPVPSPARDLQRGVKAAK